MKKKNNYQLCPLCGGRKKPRTDAPTTDPRDSRSILGETPAIVDSLAVESSDDKTANDFAALLVDHRRKRF